MQILIRFPSMGNLMRIFPRLNIVKARRKIVSMKCYHCVYGFLFDGISLLCAMQTSL